MVGCTQGMLLCLDREHRMAYVLGDVLQFNSQDAALACSVTPATHRKRLQRARSRLQTFMRGHCGLLDPANPCRCHRRVGAAIAHGRADPAEPPVRHPRRRPQTRHGSLHRRRRHLPQPPRAARRLRHRRRRPARHRLSRSGWTAAREARTSSAARLATPSRTSASTASAAAIASLSLVASSARLSRPESASGSARGRLMKGTHSASSRCRTRRGSPSAAGAIAPLASRTRCAPSTTTLRLSVTPALARPPIASKQTSKRIDAANASSGPSGPTWLSPIHVAPHRRMCGPRPKGRDPQGSTLRVAG